MATILDDEAWLCVDCGLIVANDDDSGIENAPGHRAAMAAESELNPGHRVVSGCEYEGGAEWCESHEHRTERCRFDREFSSVRCDGCGTYLAGYRFAAVIFAA